MHVLFGDYEFDSGRRLLLRHGAAVPLSPKAFDLLLILLERRPEAVAKNELLDSLWANVFVSDGSVHNLVAEIRRALHEDSRSPRYIRTVPRYGYAFHGDARSAAVDRGRAAAARGPLLTADRDAWRLVEGANVIGRDHDCAVGIDSHTVSRRHANIVVAGGTATIEDLGSKNGTSVNGQEIRGPVTLSEGDEIRVGSVSMTYRSRGALPSTMTQRCRS